MGNEFIKKEISPLANQIDASRTDFIARLNGLNPSHPQFGKQFFDMENKVFKTQVEFGLKIEEKLFSGVEKLYKDGRLDKGYFASYQKEIKKP